MATSVTLDEGSPWDGGHWETESLFAKTAAAVRMGPVESVRFDTARR